MDKKNLSLFLLALADNALILGHRQSEWCGHGPVLEQDIALTNTALDHIGQARNFYQYAADLINELDTATKASLFKSVALNNKLASSQPITEDDLAYLRDSWDFKNHLIVELPNNDWGYTIARSFYYDQFTVLLYSALLETTDKRLNSIAEKSLKEAKYHLRWSSEWTIRLGDGTEESHERMQKSIANLWEYTGELFEDSAIDVAIAEHLNIALPSSLKAEWLKNTSEILSEATLSIQDPELPMQSGGKNGIHTEHLGYILSEMQYMQRAYPNMEW